MQPQAGMTASQVQAYNTYARNLCVGKGLRMNQPIFSATFDTTVNNIVTLPPRYVGLILGFIVGINGTLTVAAETAPTLTQLATLNLLQTCVLTDLNNQQRINTTGWHLGLINSARQGYVFGGSYAPNVPPNFGNNWTVQSAPAAPEPGNITVQQLYYVPVSYSLTDLRGAIYAAVNNATMTLSLTIIPNAQICATDTSDPTLTVYQSNTGSSAAVQWAAGASCTVTVQQLYLDQLPRDPNSGNPILPILDLNNIYELKNITTNSVISANQDFPVPYSNYRQFLSTTVIFDNGGVLNTGSDVNYWKIQSANFTNITQVSPTIAALMQRQVFMADPPDGVYYFDSRSSPINTANYGNMELVLNAATGTVNSGAVLMIGYEDFAQVNQLVGATSLPG